MTNKKINNLEDTHIYLIGSGIAGLASAFYLEKDAGIPGKNIHILENTYWRHFKRSVDDE